MPGVNGEVRHASKKTYLMHFSFDGIEQKVYLVCDDPGCMSCRLFENKLRDEFRCGLLNGLWMGGALALAVVTAFCFYMRNM